VIQEEFPREFQGRVLAVARGPTGLQPLQRPSFITKRIDTDEPRKSTSFKGGGPVDTGGIGGRIRPPLSQGRSRLRSEGSTHLSRRNQQRRFLEVTSATSRLSRWQNRWQSDRLFPWPRGKDHQPGWKAAAGDPQRPDHSSGGSATDRATPVRARADKRLQLRFKRNAQTFGQPDAVAHGWRSVQLLASSQQS